ncbi:MAG: ribonuclease E/G, partial [Micrococcales bacterium]
MRLRDIGGIIVIDFIDMVLESNRDLVQRRLIECLSRDRTKHQVAEVTSLGLVQMTRKKLGIGLLEAFSEPCEACASRGVIVHHEPIMRSKNHHPMEDNSGGGQGSSKNNKKKQKNQEKKQEVAKIVSPEQAQQLGSVISAIAASTVAAHEAAGEESPIVLNPVKTDSAEPADLLETVLEALPEPKAAGQGKRKPRTRRGSSGK